MNHSEPQRDWPSHTRSFSTRRKNPGETVVDFLDGYKGKMMGKGKEAQHNGHLIVTNQRVVFYRKGLLGEIYEHIPLEKITSIEEKTLLGHRTVRIHTAHDELEFKCFSNAEKFRAVVLEIERRRGPKAAPSNDSTATTLATQIRELSSLRDEGLITDTEFETKKRNLLGL